MNAAVTFFPHIPQICILLVVELSVELERLVDQQKINWLLF